MTQQGSAATGSLRAGSAAGGQLRWTAVELTDVIEEARSRLDLAPVASIAFGRCAAAAALLLGLSKKPLRQLELDARGDGPLHRILVEIGSDGCLRGLVAGAQACGVDGPEDLRVGPALGKGVLRIGSRGEAGTSYQSHVELVSGEIGRDVAHYLAQSKQRRSAVLLGVLLRPEGVSAAGGLIVEAARDADLRLIEKIECAIAGLGSVSRRIGAGGIDEVVAEVLGEHGADVVEGRELRYRCSCNRHALVSQLAILGREEIAELVEADGTLAAECAYCGELYRLRLEELLPS